MVANLGKTPLSSSLLCHVLLGGLGAGLFVPRYTIQRASQVVLVVKNPHANAGDIREAGLTPGSERSPGGGHGNPLQYSCLENSMDKGAWRATIHRAAKSQTRLKRLSKHAHSCLYLFVYFSLQLCQF